MSQLNLEDLQNLSLSLAQTVLDQGHWNEALVQMTELFGGAFATFELIDKTTGNHLQHIDCSDIEVQREYVDHFMPLSPRIAFGNQISSPAIIHDRLFINETQMDQDPFYSDFLRPLGLRYFLAFKALETSQTVGVFTIQKNERAGPIEVRDIKMLNHLEPLLRGVASAQVQYGDIFARSDALESLMKTTRVGVFVFDTNGILLIMNSAAENLLKRQDGLVISSGQLKLTGNAAQKKFEQFQHTAAFGDILTSPIAVFLAERESGLPPLKITLQRINPQQITGLSGSPQILALVEDPIRKTIIDVEELADGFGFTIAEAHVAAMLADGKTASEIAGLNRVALATVRTQIQHVMQKLRVNRQADAVRILSQYI